MMWSWCLIPRSSGNCPGNRRLSCAAVCQSIESGGCSRLPLPYRGQFPGLWDMDAVDLPFCGEGFTCQQALFCSSCFWRMVHSTMELWPNVVLVCLSVPVIKKNKNPDESNMRDKVFTLAHRSGYTLSWQGSQGSRNYRCCGPQCGAHHRCCPQHGAMTDLWNWACYIHSQKAEDTECMLVLVCFPSLIQSKIPFPGKCPTHS